MGEEVKVVLVRSVSNSDSERRNWIWLYEDVDGDDSYRVYVRDKWEKDRIGEVVVLRKTDELVDYRTSFFYWEEVGEAK